MNRSTLHDITLPLTWLRELLVAPVIQTRHTFMISHLMEPIAGLLENVYNGAGKAGFCLI